MRSLKNPVRGFSQVSLENLEREKRDLGDIRKKSMPILKCRCGVRILLIPDLSVMNKAIEKHLADHRKFVKKSKTLSKEIEDLRQFLVKQLFELSSSQIIHNEKT
ncbi:MAG: hypothetical protein IAX22_04845 [Candidatus Bathyarchaeota archaeon]|nr:hypothetical protein [Candidatus Bathyarchaeota archaeon]